MRHTACEGCGQSSPQGETVAMLGKTLCRTCAEQFLNVATQPVPQDAVQRQVDPTVCGFCSADAGEQELPKVFGVPTCQTCDDKLRHRPFPRWIKVSAVLLVLLLIGAFAYNLRFLRAHRGMVQAFYALKDGDVHEASERMSAAVALVPDEPQLQVLAALFAGGDLLAEEKPDEALAKLQYAQSCLHSSGPLRLLADEWLNDAHAGVAFNAKDYDKFLAICLERYRKHPQQAHTVMSMASAHACKYVVTGDEKHKIESQRFLDEAAKLPQSPNAEEYRQRIAYRLHARTILTRKQFHEQFPNGWKPEKQP